MAEGDLDACSPMVLLREAAAGMATAGDMQSESARTAQPMDTGSSPADCAAMESPAIDVLKGTAGVVAGESPKFATASRTGVNGGVDSAVGVNGGLNGGRARAHWPRISLYHGRADKTVSWRHSESLSRALHACGAPHVNLTIYDGKSHTDPILEDPLSGNDQLLRSLLGLLRSDVGEPDAGPPGGAHAAPAAGCVRCCDGAVDGLQSANAVQGTHDGYGRPGGGCVSGSSGGGGVLPPARREQQPAVATNPAAMARRSGRGAEPILLPRAVPALLVEFARIVNPF